MESQGVALGDRSVACYARKLGVFGETIDEKELEGLRIRLRNLLVEDGNEIFELYGELGWNPMGINRESFPYFLRVDRKDPRSPNSPFRIVATLVRPVMTKAFEARKRR